MQVRALPSWDALILRLPWPCVGQMGWQSTRRPLPSTLPPKLKRMFKNRRTYNNWLHSAGPDKWVPSGVFHSPAVASDKPLHDAALLCAGRGLMPLINVTKGCASKYLSPRYTSARLGDLPLPRTDRIGGQLCSEK